MSLSKIGKVSNAVKLLNTAATSGDIATGISSLSNSLRAAGNMSAGVNWISKYGKVLDSGIAYQALKQAFPEESLTEDMLAKIGYTANGAGKVGNASKFSSVGSTFAGLGTFLKSIWPVLAVVGGIAAGTAAWKWADDKFTITKATAKKHSDESAQAYQNAKTELSTKQSQYDTNQDRIHELRATQNRTSDENAELSQLTKENSLLGTQVSVQKKLVDAKAQQQAIDADMNLNKKYTTSQAVANEYSDSVVAKQEDIVEETTRKVNELAELQKKRDAAYQKLDQMSADDEGFTEQQNIANQMDDRVSKKQSEIADAMDEISDDYNRLFDEDTGALINPKTKDTAKSVEDLFSLYGRVTDSAQEETDRINNIFAKAKFDGVEDQLVNAGKSGGTDAVKAKISEIDGLQEALDNAGISADTLGNLFTKYANPQRGDIVIFYRNGTFAHTGLVTKVEGDKFYTIEGNTSGGSSIVPNGGGVYAKSYYNSNLPGTKFCRPDYSIVTSILTSNTSSTSSPAPVQPSYTAWVGSCTANGTDVFSGATGASKLSTYPKLNAGNLVDIIGESGTRYQVRIAAKYIGYVEKSNIKNPNTPAATTTKKYPFVGKVTASKLNVRKKPGTEHPLLPEYPMLNKDNLINVLGVTKDTKGDRWYKVSITKKEYVGYVSAKYIIKA